MKKTGIFALLIIFFNLAQSQEIGGDWQGALKVSGMEIPLIFHIEKNDSTFSSSMDSPKQGAFGIKADHTTFENPILEIAFPSAGITYEGTYNAEDEIIEGTFKQGGMNLPLTLSKNTDKATNWSPLRPQEPKPPLPYRSEDISFVNSRDGTELSGTITLPKGPGPYPAVVLISGSGPQDRNSEIVGHKPFLVIADHLTGKGIAVLRYDERGVKESQGDYWKATSRDLTTDVQAAINYLVSRKEINQNKIGLIGHSEGGLFAPIVAEESNEVDFIILLAGPGLPGDKNLLLQKRLLEERIGQDTSTVNQGQKIFSEAYTIIRNLEGEELRLELKNYFERQLADQLNENQIQTLVKQLTTPLMQFYLRHDPALILEKTTLPVLALYGENDFQVPPKENSEIVKKSLEKAGNRDVTVNTFEKLNHLFQESATGLPNEYTVIEQTISPKVLDTISTWILDRK